MTPPTECLPPAPWACVVALRDQLPAQLLPPGGVVGQVKGGITRIVELEVGT